MRQLLPPITATAVLSDAKAICDAVKRVSPDTLTVLDGVCSVGSEEIRMDEWGVDLVSVGARHQDIDEQDLRIFTILSQVLAASQKGLGVPPGLCVTCASQKAISAFKARKAPPTSYFASWSKWLPVMEAYSKGAAAYFATPSVVSIEYGEDMTVGRRLTETSDIATYLRSSSIP